MTAGNEPAPAADAGDVDDAITVILADDHEIVREGLRLILEAEPGMSVVAEVGDAETARRRSGGLKPSVLVLDLRMPGEPSLQAIPSIREASPETAIVILTMQREPAYAREAFRLGARGFVVKHSAGSELVAAIRQVLGGGTYVSPALGVQLATEPEGAPGGLTPREAEILGLIADGYTNPEIAERLVVSVRTVETHRAGIHRKLGTSNRASLVSFAREHGLAAS